MTRDQEAIEVRPGSRPVTTPRTPHLQLDQFSPEPIQRELWTRMITLDGITAGHSLISAPSSRALHLAQRRAHGPAEAFLIGTEFAHLHGDGSGSLHLTLPRATGRTALAAGWGEPHPAVALGFAPPTTVMIFSPRDEYELEVVGRLVVISHEHALG
ncbi:MAG: luciferase family protein [Propionibacteriaceae bacterium]